MACGFLTQPRRRTVTGMLVPARLAGVWPHHRAHRFFSRARWSADQLGLVMLDLIVRLLLPVDTPILLAADDTLCKRTGRKVHGAAWHRDAATKGRRKQVAWGNDWVVVGVLVSLPFLPHRRVCLPVAARLWRPAKGNSNATRKHPGHPTKPELARELVEAICTRYPNRQIHLVGDAAYAGRVWRRTPTNLTVTCRLRADAALYQLPGPRPPGSPGRPPVKGQPMPELIVLAGLVAVDWQPATITCYGRQRDTEVATWRCLWYGPLGPQPVQVVLVRPRGAPDGYDLALVSTDLDAAGAELVSRYSHRWQIEVAFEEARQVAGVGQARNRTRAAAERTVPFELVCVSLVVV